MVGACFVSLWLSARNEVLDTAESVARTTAKVTAIDTVTFSRAINFHALTVETPVVRVGEPLLISYTYDKRKDCAPPGGTGRHIFMAEQDDRLYPLLPLGLADIEPAGLYQIWRTKVATNDPMLAPGVYNFKITAKFSCQGEPGEQVILSPKSRFEVIP